MSSDRNATNSPVRSCSFPALPSLLTTLLQPWSSRPRPLHRPGSPGIFRQAGFAQGVYVGPPAVWMVRCHPLLALVAAHALLARSAHPLLPVTQTTSTLLRESKRNEKRPPTPSSVRTPYPTLPQLLLVLLKHPYPVVSSLSDATPRRRFRARIQTEGKMWASRRPGHH
ncbi:hypothetical protein C8F01DRAFT_1130337 [Mycena amicta]|nr:hypothetical protein C8F01DRAFT_1130337 [Mycena amicta]